MTTLGEVKEQVESWKKRHPDKHLPKETKTNIMEVLESHPVGQVARALNISEPTVRSWLLRAQKKVPRARVIPQQAAQIPQSLSVVPQMKRSGYELEIEQESSKTILWFETQDLVSIFFRSIIDKNPIVAIKLRNKP